MSQRTTIEVGIEGRESLKLSFQLSSNAILEDVALEAIGGPELLTLVSEWRRKMTGDLQELELPQGDSVAAILMRELILKAQKKWNFPYQHEELCHCRVVMAKTVDAAICTGAHTPEKVSRLTSASTACGTCSPDVEEIIKFRLQR